MTDTDMRYHSSHWGGFRVRMTPDGLDVAGLETDPVPSPLIHNISVALTHSARLTRPMVRRGWLTDGPGPDSRRGIDDYVALPWDEVLDMTAMELQRLRTGPDAGRRVFGGSYGWSSAGRFHHAQSQVHRFLNCVFGGYVRSTETYSSGAGAVILDMVIGDGMKLSRTQAIWEEIEAHSDTVLAFGGLPLRNLQVSPGGISCHDTAGRMGRLAARGGKVISISPIRDDTHDLPGIERDQPRPGTDTALMLGIAHRLVEAECVDRDYLHRYTVGFDRFEAYLTGATDGTSKNADWASGICGLPADRIRTIADRAAAGRTHVTVAYALQRASQGEQPIWMAVTLAAMLGQWALPGGGFSYSLGSIGSCGKRPLAVPLPSMPQGHNGVSDFIPVARIADMLLSPGATFPYRGGMNTYPDIRMVYWAGGNPFHHHQNLSRLTRAFARPETVIVHESVGTATARHADIVMPVTLTAERQDIGAGGNDPLMIPMQQLVPPHEEARDDFEIFADLSRRLGCDDSYKEGRTSAEWQACLYERTATALRERGKEPPDFATFMNGRPIDLPLSDARSFVQLFHDDPDAYPLPTPSGRIEIASDRVARSGLPPHPCWIPPEEWLGSPRAEQYPFQLIANQPKGRLHSQLDFGPTSMAEKHEGREVARMNSDDAERLGIVAGDVIRVSNDRGGFLAVARPDPGIARDVIQVPTGSWYAPKDLPGVGVTCVNGNPNAVTADVGASPLSQGCTGQLCLVSVVRWTSTVPRVIPHREIFPHGGADGFLQRDP